mgnify:CR=1 FL=1
MGRSIAQPNESRYTAPGAYGRIGLGEVRGTVPALAFVRRNQDRPFFLYLPYHAPSGSANLERTGAENVRMISVDAVWSMEHLLDPGQVHELWTFFPDPWPKKRHHKRRLVDARFAGLVAGALVPGGRWRLATDWADYADQMQEVLDAEPTLEGGRAERWAERPLTRFERKGLTDRAVQIRVATDDRGRQIHLAEFGSTRRSGFAGRQIQRSQQCSRNRGQALDLPSHGPQARVPHGRRERRRVMFERPVATLLV